MSYKMKGFSGFKPSPAKAKGGTLPADTKNTKKNPKETKDRKPPGPSTPMPKLKPVKLPVMGKYGGEDLNATNTGWKKSNQDRDTDVKLRDDKDRADNVAKYL